MISEKLYTVKGKIPTATRRGGLITTVTTATASEIELQDGVVYIGHMPYYEAEILPYRDISSRATAMRVEKLTQWLTDNQPSLALEYIGIVEGLDANDDEYSVLVSREFYSLLHRHGKLLDSSGRPVFVK